MAHTEEDIGKGKGRFSGAIKRWFRPRSNSYRPLQDESEDARSMIKHPPVSDTLLGTTMDSASSRVQKRRKRSLTLSSLLSVRKRSNEEDDNVPEYTKRLVERLARGGMHLNLADIDLQELSRLRTVLNDRIESGLSGPELGQVIVQMYRRRDLGLGGLISRMANRQFSYAEIALATMELAGLSQPNDNLPAEVPRQPILGSNRRFSAHSCTSSTLQASRTLAHGLTVNERRGETRPHAMLHPPNRSLALHHGFSSIQPTRPRPRPVVRAPNNNRWSAPSWPPRQVVEATTAVQQATTGASQPLQYSNSSRIVRSKQPSIRRHDSDDIPLLRPATLERINRGFADEELDMRRRELGYAWEMKEQPAWRRQM